MSIATQDRVVRLLEQYQSRLHGSHDGHEEELDYIKQILASPLFQQYLNGGVASLPQREKQEIVKASADVLNGIDGTNLEDGGPVSPTEQRRRHIHRKQSLKALRNAVTPKSLQAAAAKSTQAVSEVKQSDRFSLDGQTGQHQVPFVSAEASVRYRSPGVEANGGSEVGDPRQQQQQEKRSMGYKSNSASRIEHHTVPTSQHSHLGFPATMANGELNHGKSDRPRASDLFEPLPQTQGSNNNNTHEGWVGPMSLVDARAKNLSSSSSMLIERPSPPKDYFGMAVPPVSTSAAVMGVVGSSVSAQRKVSRDSLLGGGAMCQQASLSGSQPNISLLRITQQGDLEFDDLMRGDSEDGINPLAEEERGGAVDPGAAREWNNNRFGAMGGSGSIHPPGNSVGKGKSGSGTSGNIMKLTLPPVSPPTSRPPPPPYQFNYLAQGDHATSNATPPSYAAASQQSGGGMKNRRAKSYERLLDIDQTPYPNLAPLGGAMTNGKPTQDLPTAERRKSTLVVQLRKGKEGLGFMLNKGKQKDRAGELFIQELQPGGVADRDGRLRVNDQIVRINGRSLEGLQHNEAIKLLQAEQGAIELVVLRDSHTPGHTSNLHSPQSPLALNSTHSATEHGPTSATSNSSASSALTTPLTAASTSSEASQKTFTLPQATPSSTGATASVKRPHPPKMSKYTEDGTEKLPSAEMSQSPSSEGAGSGRASSPLKSSSSSTSLLRQKIVTIDLPNNGSGFGFSVISDGVRGGAIVHSIVEGGIASIDDRLRKDDLLVQINEYSVLHMPSDDVIARLRSVSLAGLPIKLVIARAEEEEELGEEPDTPLEINDSSDEELERFEVDLHKSGGKGLGITIAGLADANTGEWLKGIYVTQLNPNGAAAKDGRIREGDRILQVDATSLRGMENMEAASVLRNSGNSVTLLLSRHRKSLEALSRGPSIRHVSHQDTPRSRRTSATHSPATSSHASPRTQSKTSLTSISQTAVHPLQMHRREVESVPGGASSLLDSSVVEGLVRKWEDVIGLNYEVKVDVVHKDLHGLQNSQQQQSLGIELTTIVDEELLSHHTVSSIDPQGPVGARHIVAIGDELLEVNGQVVRGLDRDQAASIVRDTPTVVRLVVCRPLPDNSGEEPDPDGQVDNRNNEVESATDDPISAGPNVVVSPICDSDGDHAPSENNEGMEDKFQGPTLPLPAIDNLVGDFTRRFERQSWRERHERERRRLKQNFELRREEFVRHMREQEEELLEQENEIKKRQEWQTKQEEKEDVEEEEEDSSLDKQNQWLPFDYTSYVTPNSNFNFADGSEILAAPGEPDLPQGSDSGGDVLSPVPGSTSWESDLSEVDLIKGQEGLGFSLLDFADPDNEEERVILIHSIVEGGAADIDGRLRVGDRLLHVNHASVQDETLEFTVKLLTSIPLGSSAIIGVNHPLPNLSELGSGGGGNSCWTMSPESAISPDEVEEEEEEEDEDEEEEEDGYGGFSEQSTVVGGNEPHQLHELMVLDLEPEGKPPSSAEETTVRPGVDEEDQFKGEDEAHFKSKKPTDSDDEDEEPPPPYTAYDPQEEKTEEDKKDDSPEGGDEGASGDATMNRAEATAEELQPSQSEGGMEGENTALAARLSSSLLQEHPKLIPESSLGFSYHATSTPMVASHNNGRGPNSGDPAGDVGLSQLAMQQQTVTSRSSFESEASSKPVTTTTSPRSPTTAASPQSPTSLSRVSSPERGRTLSEMTRITPEDESRMNLGSRLTSGAIISSPSSQVAPTTPISSFGLSGKTTNSTPDLGSSPSPPDVSNVPSSVSQSSTENSQGAPPVPNTSSSSSSVSSGLKSLLSKGKGKSKKQDKVSSKYPGSGSSGKSSKSQKKGKHKNQSATASVQNEQKNSQSSQSPSSHYPSSQAAQNNSLKVGNSGTGSQPLTNSQESFVDGLSPELSDYGEQSNEMDPSPMDPAPRDAQILCAGYSLGMQVSMDTKANCVVVKSVSSNGAVGRDGRVRVGDKIEAVNGESVADLSLNKVKQMLKRAAKANEFTITYMPSLVSGHTHFSLPPQTNSVSSSTPASAAAASSFPPGYNSGKNVSKSSLPDSRRGVGGANEGVVMGGASKVKNDAYYSQLPSMVAPLHDQDVGRQVGPSMPMHGLAPQGGGGAGGGVMQQSHVMQPPPNQTGAMGSWMEGGGVSSYHHQMQPGYYNTARTMEDQMGKPPPPYMFPHQGPPTTTGRMLGGQSPFSHMAMGGAQAPTHANMSWQLPHPQGLVMAPHNGGAMNWNMSGPPQGSGPPAAMVMREPGPPQGSGPPAARVMREPGPPQSSGPPAAMVMREPPQYNDLHTIQAPINQSLPSQGHGQFQHHPPPPLSHPPGTTSHLSTQNTQQQQQQQQQTSRLAPDSHQPPHQHQQQQQQHLHLNQQQQQQQQQQQNASGINQLHQQPQQQASILHSGAGTAPSSERRHGSRGSSGQQQQQQGMMPPTVYNNSRGQSGGQLHHQHSSGKKKREDNIGGSHISSDHYRPQVGMKKLGSSQSEAEYSSTGGGTGERLLASQYTRTSVALQESPDHSHHNSWARPIEELEEEDPKLRAEFPDVDGYLFSVTLNKGKAGLGLNIISETNSKAVRGIVIMRIHPGGVADQCDRLCWGDVILKMNGVSVIGMSQEQFQKLLQKAPPTVTFVVLRHVTQGQHVPSDSTSSDVITLDGLAVPMAVSLIKDGKKGLGFTIEKGEKTRGSSDVLIASITPGGPADLEGTLQVGQQVISVDKEKILGYAYEKARVLIQQAKARGRIDLVVCSRTVNSSKSSHTRSSGSDISRDRSHQVPDGVVLREKKNSLKASRKRPVSVDTNINPTSQSMEGGMRTSGGGYGGPLRADSSNGPFRGDSTNATKGGINVTYSSVHSGGGGGDAVLSHRYSNRNSHPFTDRELEQTFQQVNKLSQEIIPYKECDIEIPMHRGAKVAGVILIGGSDSVLSGVYVKKLIPDSPAHKDGRLRPADQLLMINNVSMERASHNTALQALQRSSSRLRLTVYRDPEVAQALIKADPDLSATSPVPIPTNKESSNVGGGTVETVEIVKPDNGGLGLMICEDRDKPGVFVQNVVFNEPAFLDQRLKAGDRILAINGVNTTSARQDYVVQLLQQCHGTVKFIVEHQSDHSTGLQQQQQQQQEFKGGDDHAYSTRMHPSYQIPRIPSEREPPPYSNTLTQRTFDNNPGNIPGNGGNYTTIGSSVNYVGQMPGGSGYGGGGMKDYVSHTYNAPPTHGAHSYSDIDMPLTNQEEEQILVFKLQRGSDKLGFSIVGGEGSQHGDLPIYVNKIYPDGAVGKDGRLRKGDEILSVNGVSFIGATHEYAADHLKHLPRDVEFTIRRRNE